MIVNNGKIQIKNNLRNKERVQQQSNSNIDIEGNEDGLVVQ